MSIPIKDVLLPYLIILLEFSLQSSASHGLPLVIQFLTLGKGELHFCFPIFEINAKRNQSISAFLDLSHQLPYFPSIEKELPGPCRVQLTDIGCIGIWRYMHIVEPRLAIFEAHIAISDVGPCFPQGLDLRPEKDKACLHSIFYVILMSGLTILADDLYSLVTHSIMPIDSV
jgi:hypothetical protein